MNINELKPRQGSVELIAEVVEKGDIREFNKFGKSGRVCNAKLKDETGTIALTLWNEQIDQVKVGDKVQIKNGYVNEWQGEPQLTTGKFGSMEIIGSSAASKPKQETGTHPLTDDEKTEEDSLEELDKPTESPEESTTPDEDLDVEEEKVE